MNKFFKPVDNSDQNCNNLQRFQREQDSHILHLRMKNHFLFCFQINSNYAKILNFKSLENLPIIVRVVMFKRTLENEVIPWFFTVSFVQNAQTESYLGPNKQALGFFNLKCVSIKLLKINWVFKKKLELTFCHKFRQSFVSRQILTLKKNNELNFNRHNLNSR